MLNTLLIYAVTLEAERSQMMQTNDMFHSNFPLYHCLSYQPISHISIPVHWLVLIANTFLSVVYISFARK